jgi:hypothetical protein
MPRMATLSSAGPYPFSLTAPHARDGSADPGASAYLAFS